MTSTAVTNTSYLKSQIHQVSLQNLVVLQNIQISVLLLSYLTFLSLHTSPSLSEKCHPNDKKALLKIKQELNNPYILISWDPKTDCCQWGTVKCDPTTNRITNLDVAAADLNRPFPPTVADLSYLQSLTFFTTNLTGQIPPSITKLTRLTFIDLRYNKLSGPVPSFLSKLKKLNYLALSYNNLSGEIPASLSELTNLGGLLLEQNKLTGRIPDSFGQFEQQTFYMYLSGNQLSGEIPRTMGYANYTYIDASRNRLVGDISFLFGKNKSLRSVDFSNVEFSDSLMDLDLSHDKIKGMLPKGLAGIDLISLNVSYNRLCGQIPAGGRLQGFESSAYFHNRCLCGYPLPACK